MLLGWVIQEIRGLRPVHPAPAKRLGDPYLLKNSEHFVGGAWARLPQVDGAPTDEMRC